MDRSKHPSIYTEVIDEAKSVPLLGGHLSPKSYLFDQILP